ncbi:MFS transporter [Vallitalea okinawensis]|uniref:MFS transporter n=1 Tax=Vallitalea okinawensis TaxID=2078660 RepID=UPI000CFBA8E9|nr:MFS transporter [Vallitalea okinawensis]
MTYKGSIKRILFYQFISMMIFNLAHPVTPALIKELSYPDYAFGILFATMSLLSFVTAPLWGQLADKIGHKKVLFIGPFGSALGQLGFGLSTHLGLTIFFRAFTGAFSMATVSVSLVYLAAVSSEEDKKKNLAYSAALTGIGSMLGYLLGGLIGEQKYQYTFFAQVGLLLLLPILVLFCIQQLKDNEHTSAAAVSFRIIIDKVSLYIVQPMGKVFIYTFLLTFGYTLYTNTIPYYLVTIWNMPSSFVGYFMTFSGFLNLIANMVLLPMFLKKFSPTKILFVESLILSLSLFCFVGFKDIRIIIPTLTIYLTFLAMYKPLNQMIISVSTRNDQGVIFGIMNSFNALGMILGGLLSGFAFELSYNLPFILAAIIFGITGCLVFLFKKREKIPKKSCQLR